MEEAISQVGELFVGVLSALTVIGAVMLLLSQSDAGLLRQFLTDALTSAC